MKNARLVASNSLIVLALLLVFYIYLPFLKLYLPTTETHKNIDKSYSIYIPKINAQAPIIESVDPWNKSNYEESLKKGIAEAKDFELDNKNNKPVFLFAHSSLPFWEMTRVNSAFLRLHELKVGDQILIYKDNKEFKYEVTEKKEVWPSEVNLINEANSEQLILQTCTPIGTDLKRLLVFATPL